MNLELGEILKAYSLGPHQKYAERLHELSKDSLIGVFSDLLTMYINDKNSSTIREFITVSMAGYEHSGSKIGYNGFKHVTAGKPLACEAKPVNVTRLGLEMYRSGERKTCKKLDGGGNYTDYSWKRHEKYCRDNPHILVSGFVDGRIIYLFEFPFRTSSFRSHFEEKLEKRFPKGDIKGEFIRSVTFDYRHYVDTEDLKILYCEETVLDEYKDFLRGTFHRDMKRNLKKV